MNLETDRKACRRETAAVPVPSFDGAEPAKTVTPKGSERMKITVTVTNNNPDTIYNKLAAKLGRAPTNAECKEEIFRILSDKK